MSIKLNLFICAIFVLFLTARTLASEVEFEKHFDDALFLEDEISNLNFDYYNNFKSNESTSLLRSNELHKTYNILNQKIKSYEDQILYFSQKKFKKRISSSSKQRQKTLSLKLQRTLRNKKIQIDNQYFKEKIALNKNLNFEEIINLLTTIQLPGSCSFLKEPQIEEGKKIVISLKKNDRIKKVVIDSNRILKASTQIIYQNKSLESSAIKTSLSFSNDKKEKEKMIWISDRFGKVKKFLYTLEKSHEYLIEFKGIKLYEIIEPKHQYYCI